MSEEMAFDTHSIVWMVHGVAAPVLPGRHTAGKNNNDNRLLRMQHLKKKKKKVR